MEDTVGDLHMLLDQVEQTIQDAEEDRTYYNRRLVELINKRDGLVLPEICTIHGEAKGECCNGYD